MIDTTRRDQLIDQIAGALQRLRADLSSALNDLETLHHVVYGLPPAPTEWTVEPARPGSADGMNLEQLARLKSLLAADEQHAAMQLAAVCKPELLKTLVAEAERRATFITELVQRTPWPGPTGTQTSRAAGLRSVFTDVTTRRLP